MNELYVNECWLYFKTKECTKEQAIQKLYDVCNSVGIELTVENSVLRNENGEDIE